MTEHGEDGGGVVTTDCTMVAEVPDHAILSLITMQL